MVTIDDRFRTRTNRLINRTGKVITYRRITKLTGPNPAINPPSTGSLQAAAIALTGATTINLTSPSVSGRLVAGDKLTIAGAVYTLTSEVVAVANTFTGLTFTPTLAADVAAGDAVLVAFSADVTVTARISGYSENMMGGTLVQIGDFNVVIPATQITFTPTIVDKLIIDGIPRSIVSVTPQYAASLPASWRIQAR